MKNEMWGEIQVVPLPDIYLLLYNQREERAVGNSKMIFNAQSNMRNMFRSKRLTFKFTHNGSKTKT